MRLSVKQTALFSSICFCAITAFTLNNYGITWDEGVYIKAGDSYCQWLRNPSLQNIENYWKLNNEHPPLTKLLGGITKYLFHEKLNLLSSISSFRLSVLIFVFFSNYFLFRFVAEIINYRIALVATASFFFLPRIFFHAHLGAMDYAITSLWFLVIYAYWRGLKDPKWILVSSVLLGLAFLTKINAFLIYVPLLFSWVVNRLGKSPNTFQDKAGVNSRPKTRIYFQIIPIFIIPPIIFLIGWPWLWKDPLPRISEYLSFHMHHAIVYVYYLETQSPLTPWHYPFVIAFITIPLVTLIPFFIGGGQVLFRPNKTNAFLLFNALFPLMVIALPSVPKYDGVRLFLPAFPFICMVAGMGVQQIYLWAQKIKGGQKFYLIYLTLFFLTVYFSIFKIHPYQSSYFNEIIGGIDGAVKKGFEAEYWGNAYIGVLPWLNARPDMTFWIYMADIEPKILWGLELYKYDGRLKKSVKFGNRNNSDYLILLIRQGFFNEEMWKYYLYQEPVFSVKVTGANLVNIYEIK